MKKLKKSWIALLLGVLLLATLVGAVWALPKSHHGGYHYTVTLPGGHFRPNDDNVLWATNGNWIRVDSASAYFTAPLPILPGNRTVESVTMYVVDNSSDNACFELWRSKTDTTRTRMAGLTCSSGASTSLRSFSDTSISPSTIWGGHGALVGLSILGTGVDVYAIQIEYY